MSLPLGRGERPFRYCRPHYVNFLNYGRPVVHDIIIFSLPLGSVLLPHTEPGLLLHVCLAVFLLSILLQ